jgi:hypothetical protein
LQLTAQGSVGLYLVQGRRSGSDCICAAFASFHLPEALLKKRLRDASSVIAFDIADIVTQG